MEESCDAQLYTYTGDSLWVHCNLDDENGVGITVVGESRDGTASYVQFSERLTTLHAKYIMLLLAERSKLIFPEVVTYLP